MTWLAVAAAFVAVVAALSAYQAARRTVGVLPPSPPADRPGRRGAPLAMTVLDADARLNLPGGMSHYAFLLSIANDSAMPRTFATVALLVRYRTPANFIGAVDVALTATAEPDGSRTGEVTLRLPIALAAHQSLIGWVHFVTGPVVPDGCRIDGYAILMQGDAGEHLAADVTVATVRQGSAAWDAAR